MQKTMEQSFREMMDALMGEGWETITHSRIVALMKTAYMSGSAKTVERIFDGGATKDAFDSVSLELLHYFQGDPRRN